MNLRLFLHPLLASRCLAILAIGVLCSSNAWAEGPNEPDTNLYRHIAHLSGSGMSDRVTQPTIDQSVSATPDSLARATYDVIREVVISDIAELTAKDWTSRINSHLEAQRFDIRAAVIEQNGESQFHFVGLPVGDEILVLDPIVIATFGATGNCTSESRCTDASDCTDATDCTSGQCTKHSDCTSLDCTKSTWCTFRDSCTSGSYCTANLNSCTSGNWCTVNSEHCTLGTACTQNDTCTKATSCTDNTSCTGFGNCSQGPNCTKGKFCSRGSGCTLGSKCSQGDNCTKGSQDCTSGSNCSQGGSCTRYSGCTASSKCSRGNGCTSNWHCSSQTNCTSGTCTKGGETGSTCTDAIACTNVSYCATSNHCKTAGHAPCTEPIDVGLSSISSRLQSWMQPMTSYSFLLGMGMLIAIGRRKEKSIT